MVVLLVLGGKVYVTNTREYMCVCRELAFFRACFGKIQQLVTRWCREEVVTMVVVVTTFLGVANVTGAGRGGAGSPWLACTGLG